MKVGILTLPLHKNYGGILQAVALKTIIKRLGFEVVFYDKPRPKDISLIKKFIHYPIRTIKKYLFGKDVQIDWEYRLVKNREKIYNFTDRHISRTIINSIEDIKVSDIDTLVIGSDQVWRYIYWKIHYNNPLDAFGRFAIPSCNVVSYAASFGRDDAEEYPLELKEEISILLKQFSKISVREISGVKICKDCFDVDAVVNLDPTFLITKSEWNQICENIPSQKHSILTYILDDTEKTDDIRDCVKGLLMKDEIQLRLNSGNEMMPCPEEWIASFRDADFVVTDSFHGTVFSIIFEKPFIVIPNDRRGMGRIKSLLKMFGLQQNLVSDTSEIRNLNLYNHADKTREILKVERERSLNWLKDALLSADTRK